MDISQHPCFNEAARAKFGRVHLPVAPACNLQCNFCDRKYDCPNESRPGVSSVVLSPGQALAYFRDLVKRRPNISVVGIAGPGDPMANPEATLETLRLIRAEFPEVLLCLATNGLDLLPYIDELLALKLSHITLTINAIDPEIGAQIYAWVRNGRRPLRGLAAAEFLRDRQLAALTALQGKDLLVKVNSILIPGVNDTHIPAIAEKVASLGAGRMNIIPLIPTADTPFGCLPAPDKEMIHRTRKAAEAFLPQMAHCQRCRADACGLLNEGTGSETLDALQAAAHLPLRPGEARPYVAVATRDGLLVNQHLGEARELLVYGLAPDGALSLIGSRITPEPGGGNERWTELAETLRDCQAILVGGAGPTPRKILETRGLKILEIDGLIDDALPTVLSGSELPGSMKRCFAGCGKACSGNGQGCS